MMETNTITLSREDYDNFKLIEHEKILFEKGEAFVRLDNNKWIQQNFHANGGYYKKGIMIFIGDDNTMKNLASSLKELTEESDELNKNIRERNNEINELILEVDRLKKLKTPFYKTLRGFIINSK